MKSICHDICMCVLSQAYCFQDDCKECSLDVRFLFIHINNIILQGPTVKSINIML